MSSSRIALGFVAAVAVGGGSGLALNLAAGSLVQTVSPNPSNVSMDPPLKVTRVTGVVEVYGSDGTWRKVRAGQVLLRPAAVRTRGFGAEAQLSYRGTELVVGHDAELLVGAAGIETGLQLDAGRVLVQRRARPLTTALPTRATEVSGSSYAIRISEDKVTLAVLDGEAAVKRGTDAPVMFGRAREVTITDKQMTPLIIEPKLEVAVTGVTRIGKKATIAGRTAPTAELFLDRGDGFEPVALSAAGAFSFEIDAPEVPAGALVAYDALGRRAEPKQPSVSLEELLATLGAPPAAAPKDAAPPAPPAAPPEDAPREAKESPPPKAAPPASAEPQSAPAKAPVAPQAKVPAPKSVKATAEPPLAPLPKEPPAAKVPSLKRKAPETVTEDEEEAPPPRPAVTPPPPKEAPDEEAIDEDQL